MNPFNEPTKYRKTLKYLVIFLLSLLLIWPFTFGLVWLVDQGYSWLDPTRFPFSEARIHAVLKSVPTDAPETQKGAALSHALTNRLEEELDSTFGWSTNDLWVSPTRWLDNRGSRQRGVIFATRMLATFYATNLAKYGSVDAENEWLKEAREKRFAFSEDSWWLPSSESEYRKGIELQRKYEAAVKEGKAVFNMRSDDIYNLFMFILSNQVLDQPMGLLVQATEDVAYSELDDRIYYTQGVILVLRDFLGAVVQLYPVVREKGGDENIRIAFREMERVCTFDPLIVLRGRHDSIMADHRGKMASYVISIRERLNDVAQSIRR
ncbi:MAG: DUF2333 family protein [Desulfobacterales bacterium]|jgi:hypothetical protein|nr:DUF2333 family protein [Desulfobacterales bacterium]